MASSSVRADDAGVVRRDEVGVVAHDAVGGVVDHEHHQGRRLRAVCTAVERPVESDRKATSVVPPEETSRAPRSSRLAVRVRAMATARAPTSDAGPRPERACEPTLTPSLSASTVTLGAVSWSRPPRRARVVWSERVTAAAAPVPSYDVASVCTEPSPEALTPWAPEVVTRRRPAWPLSR